MNITFNRVLLGYVVVTVLLPLIVILVRAIPGFQDGVLAALTLCVACAFGAYALFTSPTALKRPPMPIMCTAALLPIMGLISALFNGWTMTSLWGSGFEVGTVGSLVLFSSAAVASSLISRDQIPLVLHAFLGTVIITVGITALLPITHAEVLGESTFAGLHLSFLIAAALFLTAVCFDLVKANTMKLAYAVCFIALSGEFILFNHFQATILLLGFACFLVIRDTFPIFNAQRPTPRAVGTLAVFTAGILLLGPQISPTSSSPWPSLSATMRIIGIEYQTDLSNALVGYGPDSVSAAWDFSRDKEFNTGPLWDAPVLDTYSTMSTFLITLGLLGSLMFLIVPLELLRKRERAAPSPSTSMSNIVLTAALFLYASFFIHTADIALFLLAGVLLGLSAIPHREKADHTQLVRGSVRIVFAALFICASIGIGWVASREGIAAYYYSRGIAIRDSDTVSAAKYLAKAADTWNTPHYAVDAGLAYTVLASSYSSARASSPEDAELFKNTVLTAVRFANMAVSTAPYDYESPLFRASLYIALIDVKFPQAAEEARISIDAAHSRSMARPEPFFLQAQLDMARGNTDAARMSLKKALELKPDYERALRLWAQISGA